MQIIALQEYTDKYISLYQGQIRNLNKELAQRLIEQGIVRQHDSIDDSSSGSGSNKITYIYYKKDDTVLNQEDGLYYLKQCVGNEEIIAYASAIEEESTIFIFTVDDKKFTLPAQSAMTTIIENSTFNIGELKRVIPLEDPIGAEAGFSTSGEHSFGIDMIISSQSSDNSQLKYVKDDKSNYGGVIVGYVKDDLQLGDINIAQGSYSFAEGRLAKAFGDASHAQGFNTLARGNQSHAEGYKTTASGNYSHAEGYETTASGVYSHAEGSNTTASGNQSHTEGASTKASHFYAHAEGEDTVASGYSSHAQGTSTEASGEEAHAEGQSTIAYGRDSHAEGISTKATAHYSHAEGNGAIASGETSHAEGKNTKATGEDSHAEGYEATASGMYSHTQNYYTTAQGYAQTAIGRFNKIQGSQTGIEPTDYAFIIGNGSLGTSRSNALAIKWDGTFVFANGIEITPAQFESLLGLLNQNNT